MLDRAEWYELEILLQKYNEQNKEEWERTRFLSYIIAQTQSRKKLQLTDILKFEWDKKEQTVENKEDIQKRMEMFLKHIESKKDIENEAITLENFFGKHKEDEELSQSEKRQQQNEYVQKYRR